jgi:hypothetical protein
LSDDRDHRRHWPDELRYLLERHPRATWATSGSPSVAFWLEVHDRFRHDCSALEMAVDDYRSGRTPAARIALSAVPRVRALVGALHGHHQIEDYQYFPAFRRGEPALAAGFDALERDHTLLTHDIAGMQMALRELEAAALATSTVTLELAAHQYSSAATRLCRRLRCHLGDEEELVVPVLLARGDD